MGIINIARSYFKIKAWAKKEKEMDKLKTGIKTSEFWIALIGSLITVFNDQLGLHIPKDALLSLAGMVISYVFSRAHVKANTN